MGKICGAFKMIGDIKNLKNHKDVKHHKIEQGDGTISGAFIAAVNNGQWLTPKEFFEIAGGDNSLARDKSLEWLKEEVCTWLNTAESTKDDSVICMPGYSRTAGFMEFNPNKAGLTTPVCNDFNTMNYDGSKIATARRWLQNLTFAKSHKDEKIVLFQLLSVRGNGDTNKFILHTFTCTYGIILEVMESVITDLENQATWITFMGDYGFTRRVTGILHVCRGIMKGTVDMNEGNIEQALRLMRGTEKIISGDISAHDKANDVMFQLNNRMPKSKMVVVDQYLNVYNLASKMDDDRAQVSLFLRDVLSSRKDGAGTKTAYSIFRRKKDGIVDVTIINTSQIDDYGDNFELLEINEMLSYFIGKNIGRSFNDVH